jgi:hypothetical protein
MPTRRTIVIHHLHLPYTPPAPPKPSPVVAFFRKFARVFQWKKKQGSAREGRIEVLEDDTDTLPDTVETDLVSTVSSVNSMEG